MQDAGCRCSLRFYHAITIPGRGCWELGDAQLNRIYWGWGTCGSVSVDNLLHSLQFDWLLVVNLNITDGHMAVLSTWMLLRILSDAISIGHCCLEYLSSQSVELLLLLPDFPSSMTCMYVCMIRSQLGSQNWQALLGNHRQVTGLWKAGLRKGKNELKGNT